MDLLRAWGWLGRRSLYRSVTAALIRSHGTDSKFTFHIKINLEKDHKDPTHRSEISCWLALFSHSLCAPKSEQTFSKSTTEKILYGTVKIVSPWWYEGTERVWGIRQDGLFKSVWRRTEWNRRHDISKSTQQVMDGWMDESKERERNGRPMTDLPSARELRFVPMCPLRTIFHVR